MFGFILATSLVVVLLTEQAVNNSNIRHTKIPDKIMVDFLCISLPYIHVEIEKGT